MHAECGEAETVQLYERYDSLGCVRKGEVLKGVGEAAVADREGNV